MSQFKGERCLLIRVFESVGPRRAEVMLIDNYDSFTYNLVQCFCRLGARVSVALNDQVDLLTLLDPRYTHIVISPGPGHPQNPRDFGVCTALLNALPLSVPLLGVCLGFQGIAAHFGAEIIRAPRVMHGKTSLITHCQTGLFSGLSTPLEVMRYHSLCVAPGSLPEQLIPTAHSESDDVLMAFKHRILPIFGVQFHPESVGTPKGPELLQRFLELRSTP